MQETLWKPFRRGDLWAVFALAVILRMALFAASNNEVGTHKVLDGCFDCTLYLNEGRAIATGAPLAFENALLYFGPGYPSFLALNYLLFGGRVVLFILVNILISSLSSLFVYRLTRLLLGSYPAAIGAALMTALSYTSIALSCFILSDTLYFLIFLISLILYVEALQDRSWKKTVGAGIVTGMAILIRPIGEFWPFIMIIIAAAYYRRYLRKLAHRQSFRAYAARVAIAVVIPLVIATAWMARNYRVHGAFTMSIAGGNGPGNLAAMTLERRTGTAAHDIMKGWYDQFLVDSGKTQGSLGDAYAAYATNGWRIIDSLKWESTKTYLIVMWDNLNAINVLHRYLIPEYNNVTIPLEEAIMNSWIKYIYLAASMLGFTALLCQRQFFAAVVLGNIFLYYALMLGFYRWQYSRHFLPGQIAGSILIAFFLLTVIQMMCALVRWLTVRVR